MRRCFVLLLLFVVQTVYAQHHPVPATDAFSISGFVTHKLAISADALLHFKQDDLGDVTIKNKRGDDKEVAHKLKGVLLKTILDSADITAEKPKELSQYYVTLVASDGYTNVYSWNELYNTEVGNHVYIITEKDGIALKQMNDRILVMSLSDLNSGRRHLKGLAKIEVRKTESD